MSVCVCGCVGARLAATKGRKRRGSGGKELGEWAGVLQRGLLSKACSSSFKKSKPVAVGTVKGREWTLNQQNILCSMGEGSLG